MRDAAQRRAEKFQARLNASQPASRNGSATHDGFEPQNEGTMGDEEDVTLTESPEKQADKQDDMMREGTEAEDITSEKCEAAGEYELRPFRVCAWAEMGGTGRGGGLADDGRGQVLDAMSASGLRALRYALEVPHVGHVCALSPPRGCAGSEEGARADHGQRPGRGGSEGDRRQRGAEPAGRGGGVGAARGGLGCAARRGRAGQRLRPLRRRRPRPLRLCRPAPLRSTPRLPLRPRICRQHFPARWGGQWQWMEGGRE